MNLKSSDISGKFEYLSTILYKFLKINIPHIAKVNKNKKCTNCKSTEKIFYYSKTTPDFNVNVLSLNLFKKFYLKAIGKCLQCNLIQDYNTLNIKELEEYEKILISKDMTVSEEIWKSFPIPDERKKIDYEKYFKRRFYNWKNELNIDKNINNILFLRPSFGTIINYFDNFKNANLYYLDISDIAKKTIKSDYPKLIELEGNIHGIYRGNFLKKKNFFDLIVSQHHILHCFDIDHTFKKLKNLLNDKGKIILMNEIGIKMWNPFHINFWNEDIFVTILKKHFNKLQIIRNCGPDERDFKDFTFVSDHTKYRDSPDFVVSGPINHQDE